MEKKALAKASSANTAYIHPGSGMTKLFVQTENRETPLLDPLHGRHDDVFNVYGGKGMRSNERPAAAERGGAIQ